MANIEKFKDDFFIVKYVSDFIVNTLRHYSIFDDINK
jgi:hypothetical protein